MTSHNARDIAIISSQGLAVAYLDRLQRKDKQGILALLSEDFRLDVPNDLSGANDLSNGWHGLVEAAANYDRAFSTIETIRYVDIEVSPTLDPTVVFVEGLGDMRMYNGRAYKNRYVLRFDLEDLKIKRIREYYNPITAALAFGRQLPESAVITDGPDNA